MHISARRFARRVAFALVVIASQARGAGAQTTWNVATDWNANVNGAGAWTYGVKPTLTGVFAASTLHGTFCGGEYWGSSPAVYFNPSSNSAPCGPDFYFAPGQAFAHPGVGGEYAVFRFTAPVSGTYSLTSAYFGDVQLSAPIYGGVPGTSTDVHVLYNGVSVFNGLVNGFGVPSQQTYNATLAMLAGDYLEFEVGYGANYNYYQDYTGVQADISLLPEPNTFLLSTPGLVLAGALLRRRRKSDCARDGQRGEV